MSKPPFTVNPSKSMVNSPSGEGWGAVAVAEGEEVEEGGVVGTVETEGLGAGFPARESISSGVAAEQAQISRNRQEANWAGRFL
jgi:hypothetical protein